MLNAEIMNKQWELKPRQIVCLEHQNAYLYSEVIQVVVSRKLCWVRPLVLAIATEQTYVLKALLPVQELIDVRRTSDLLYPLNLFRPALDTEVIPLMTQLTDLNDLADNHPLASQKLRHFIEQVWQANPQVFASLN